MLRKILKITSITIGVIIAILILAYITIYSHMQFRIAKTYNISPEPIDVKYDSASIARGKHLVSIRACDECHGKDLGGSSLIDDGMIGTFSTKN
ncbi:hypothetical protein, partial [Escherichia coli]|uniref:hypothetical protein n=1 Tax=Escherichia coli TaxID=562 RepID=UPI001BDC636C